ncbi:hypothetical protein LCGC14_1673840 [marine sediment metagenome]|uniref:Uncharacterized protein n=1 Tax=marine sediment metagenome TaxID=412755 RepID=A0A0F9KQD7_9ZZZZ
MFIMIFSAIIFLRLKEDTKEFSEKIYQQYSIHEMNVQKEQALQKEFTRQAFFS